jgi:hypothetical protein
MRWAWTDGPTKGKTHEHLFHQDGTVEWREVAGEASAPRQGTGASAPTGPERVPYAAFEVTPGIYAVSYLAPSGFTLTVVLNQESHEIVGFASGAGQWHPVRGRFELVR